MKFVSTLLMYFGYLLVYAAVAAGGKFATEPWAGLFADAYTEDTGATRQRPAGPPGKGTPPFPNTAPYVPPGTTVPGRAPRRRRELIPGQPGTGRAGTPAAPGGRG